MRFALVGDRVIGYRRSIPFSYMEGVYFTAVRRGCGLYNLLSAVESIDILLSAVGVMLTVRGGVDSRPLSSLLCLTVASQR